MGLRFREAIFIPPAKHFPDAVERFHEHSVFLRIECFDFPRELKKKFQQIKFGNTSFNIEEFLFSRRDACEKNELDGFDEAVINL